ncbi:MAG TPA: hypothetical protein EYP09_04915 [Anaerolineae bacterium]|nr:hypothetical protein [Anaerolineae bacterium]
MAKRAKRRKPEKLTKKQIALGRKARRQQRMVIIGTVAIVLVIVAVIAFGYYQEYIAKPAKPVAIVDGVPIRTDLYQGRVRYRRFVLRNYENVLKAQLAQMDTSDETQQFMAQYIQQQLQQIQSQLMSAPMDVLDELIDAELIRQEAARRGIVVTPEEVQLEIESQFGYQRNPPTPTPTSITPTVPITITPTPTVAPMTEAQFRERYAKFLKEFTERTGLSEAELRRIFEDMLLERKLRAAMAEEVPTTAEHVHARHILVETEEEARQVLERLRAGEDFAALAKEFSIDEATKEEGGDLGWFPRGQMAPEFEEAAFNTPVGEITEPISTTFGYHIIEILGREERELEPYMLRSRQNKAFEEWLEEQRNSPKVVNLWSPDVVPPDTGAEG